MLALTLAGVRKRTRRRTRARPTRSLVVGYVDMAEYAPSQLEWV